MLDHERGDAEQAAADLADARSLRRRNGTAAYPVLRRQLREVEPALTHPAEHLDRVWLDTDPDGIVKLI